MPMATSIGLETPMRINVTAEEDPGEDQRPCHIAPDNALRQRSHQAGLRRGDLGIAEADSPCKMLPWCSSSSGKYMTALAHDYGDQFGDLDLLGVPPRM